MTIIRPEQPADFPDVRRILLEAFPTSAEARLVDRLRTEHDAEISLVAVHHGSIVGNAMLSRMSAPLQALGLAPVAVSPARQRSGVGSLLIQRALELARAGAWEIVFVLGDPAYYRRFGFDPALASGFTSRYAGPHFMALALTRPLPVLTGEVHYAPAFAALRV